MGAVCATQIVPNVVKNLKLVNYEVLKENIHYYLDSQCTLQWIKFTNRRLEQFIATRLALIRETTDKSQWHYIRTDKNTADLGTRSLTLNEFLKHQNFWFKGHNLESPDYNFDKVNFDEMPEEEQNEMRNSFARIRLFSHLKLKKYVPSMSFDKIRVLFKLNTSWLEKQPKDIIKVVANSEVFSKVFTSGFNQNDAI